MGGEVGAPRAAEAPDERGATVVAQARMPVPGLKQGLWWNW